MRLGTGNRRASDGARDVHSGRKDAAWWALSVLCPRGDCGERGACAAQRAGDPGTRPDGHARFQRLVRSAASERARQAASFHGFRGPVHAVALRAAGHSPSRMRRSPPIPLPLPYIFVTSGTTLGDTVLERLVPDTTFHGGRYRVRQSGLPDAGRGRYLRPGSRVLLGEFSSPAGTDMPSRYLPGQLAPGSNPAPESPSGSSTDRSPSPPRCPNPGP